MDAGADTIAAHPTVAKDVAKQPAAYCNCETYTFKYIRAIQSTSKRLVTGTTAVVVFFVGVLLGAGPLSY